MVVWMELRGFVVVSGNNSAEAFFPLDLSLGRGHEIVPF